MSDSPVETHPTAADPTPIEIAVAVVRHQNLFLIGQRPDGKPLAGYWEFPGGKVESHETPAQAAMRECLEETGQKVEACGEFLTEEHRYEHGLLRLRFYRCRADQLSPPLAPFRWVTRQELRKYEFPPANRRMLELVLAEDSSRDLMP